MDIRVKKYQNLASNVRTTDIVGFRTFIVIILLISMMSCIPDYNKMSIDEISQKIKRFSLTWDNIKKLARDDGRVNFYIPQDASNSYSIESWEESFYDFFIALGIEVNIIEGSEQELLRIFEEEKANENATAGTGSVDVFLADRFILSNVFEKNYYWGNFIDALPNRKNFLFRSEIIYPKSFLNSREGGMNLSRRTIPLYQQYFLLELNNGHQEILPELQKMKSYEDFKDFLLRHPNMFVYSNPVENLNGLSFLKSILIYKNSDRTALLYQNIESLSESQILEILYPVFEYLREIQPLLWRHKEQERTEYLSDAEIDRLFHSGQLVIKMSMRNLDKELSELQGVIGNDIVIKFPEDSILTSKDYLVISNNVKHLAASLVFINGLISLPMQVDQKDFLGRDFGINIETVEQSERHIFDMNRTSMSNRLDDNELVVDIDISWDEIIRSVWDEYIYYESNDSFANILADTLADTLE